MMSVDIATIEIISATSVVNSGRERGFRSRFMRFFIRKYAGRRERASVQGRRKRVPKHDKNRPVNFSGGSSYPASPKGQSKDRA